MYIGTEKTGILIDAGRSCKQIETALQKIGVAPESIQAVFITHEHTDHIGGLRVFAGKRHTKVYATGGTLCALDESGVLTEKYDAYALCGRAVSVGDLSVTPFRTSHDAAESCGYTVEFTNGQRLAIATDLGVMTQTVQDAVTGCETVLLESNHDVRTLENNPMYPYALKRRILGEQGHLSNEACAEAAAHLIKHGTKHLFLGHLSEQNNLPDLAYTVTADTLSSLGAKVQEDFSLCVAKPVWDGEAFAL